MKCIIEIINICIERISLLFGETIVVVSIGLVFLVLIIVLVFDMKNKFYKLNKIEIEKRTNFENECFKIGF